MPPRAESSSSKDSVRRPTSQPRSSRQQFSACGACRIRRVRCDLKDLPADSKTCSNCLEHGFNCVDEYKDLKAVKLLRRGRRIQQVEAVYGVGTSQHERSTTGAASGVPGRPPTLVIPRLDPQFFNSRFYPRFHIQRPMIEPEEFKARYISFFNGNAEALGIPGQLIAMLLVAWACSYGVDEYGREEPHDGAQGVRRRKKRTNEMIRELLHLIDIHGLPRKPTWDGVRVLLLIMPLTEDVAEPLERLTMYETAINQVYTLCSLASPRSVNSGQGDSVDALVRARIYWYAFVHEGITTGLRGGRLHLSDDDLRNFQLLQEEVDMGLTRSQLTLTYSRKWALAPLRLALACRQVHSALTGANARSRADVDEIRLHQAWESIEACWEEFESLRSLGLLGILTVEEADRFVDGWKIFIFECHNVIREFLKQRLMAATGGGNTGYITGTESQQRTLTSLTHLHSIAESKCQDVVQHVVTLIRRHLGTSFFEYDASLVRDGCFFAGYVLAREQHTEEDGNTCLQALSEMRWAFSRGEERIEILKVIWEARHIGHSRQESDTPPFDPPLSPNGNEASILSVAYPHTLDQESHPWSTTNSTKPVLSSAGDPAVYRSSEKRREDVHRSSSLSSGGSSALSTGSPSTPSLQTVTRTSSTFVLQPDGKTAYASSNDVYGGATGRRGSLTPTGAPDTVDATTYSYDPSHQPQYSSMSYSQPFVGADGVVYTPPPNNSHPPEGYPYPPYSYS